MSEPTIGPQHVKSLGHILTAAAYIADQAAGIEEPEPVREVRQQMEHTRARIIRILLELRGVDSDFRLIDRARDEHPAIEHACGVIRSGAVDDIGPAIEHVVDLLTSVQFHLDRLAEWKPEPTVEATGE